MKCFVGEVCVGALPSVLCARVCVYECVCVVCRNAWVRWCKIRRQWEQKCFFLFLSFTLNVVWYISATYPYVHCHAYLLPYFSERPCCHHMYNYSNPGTGCLVCWLGWVGWPLLLKYLYLPCLSSCMSPLWPDNCHNWIKAQRHLFDFVTQSDN